MSMIIVTLLCPIVGLFYSLYHWRKFWAKNTFWLACMYMGAIQIFHPEGTTLGIGADGGRYALKLLHMHYMELTLRETVSFLFADNKSLDLYQPILTYIISRFTANGHVLFFVFAFVFGFFYSRNIWYVLEKLEGRLGDWSWVLIAFYFLICPIWNINGVRMWTALHIFVYGAMPFVFEKDRSKLKWCFLSLLVHFSFLFPVLILLLYVFVPKSVIKIYFIFYLATLFLKEIDLSVVRNFLLEYLPIVYEDKISGYTNEEYALKRTEEVAGLSLHVILSEKITYWIIQVYIVMSFFAIRKYLKENESIKRLFIFSLLIYGVSNIFALVPSGERFLVLSQMFMIPVFLFVIKKVPKNTYMKLLHPIFMILMLFVIVFYIRKGFDFYGLSLMCGNFITMFFITTDIPIINFVKQLF